MIGARQSTHLDRGLVLPHEFTADDLHEIVDGLAAALDAKNAWTNGHSERVAEYAIELAKNLGLSHREQVRIHIGGHLHDIGKIGIPDSILNKSGKLTNEEFAIIRRHAEIGSEILGRIKIFAPILDIVRNHHERFDGQGYPDAISGNDISIGARIVAVADAFDAMTTVRPYRVALSAEAALTEVKRCRGSQFDPEIVDLLEALLEKGCFNNFLKLSS